MIVASASLLTLAANSAATGPQKPGDPWRVPAEWFVAYAEFFDCATAADC